MFLRNTWYVATRSDEIGTALTPMTILGEKIVLYRREDACPCRARGCMPAPQAPVVHGPP